MEIKDNHYQKILDFICQIGEVDDLAHFLDYVDNFLQTDFKASPILVYSTHENAKDKIRAHRKQTIEELYYKKNEVKNFRDEVKKRLGDVSALGKKEVFYYTFPIGIFTGQEYFICFKCNQEISKAIVDYFFQFLKTTLTKIDRYQEARGLKSLVYKDEITGLFNQRRFSEDIDESISRAKEDSHQFSVIFIDIDHFKQVNDGHGHLVGTKLLKDVGTIIKNSVRPDDLCYRYGGDEFVIIVKNTSFYDAKTIGERVLNNISEETFHVTRNEGLSGDSEFKLTVSVGIACYPDDATTRVDIVKLADRMMYKAKQTGRGKVCHTKELFSDESSDES